jgi:hypothetical protein
LLNAEFANEVEGYVKNVFKIGTCFHDLWYCLIHSTYGTFLFWLSSSPCCDFYGGFKFMITLDIGHLWILSNFAWFSIFFTWDSDFSFIFFIFEFFWFIFEFLLLADLLNFFWCVSVKTFTLTLTCHYTTCKKNKNVNDLHLCLHYFYTT